MSILKKIISLMCMLLMIQMSGCSTSSKPESVDTPKVVSEYTLSHGVSSLDIIEENLNYEGNPLQFEYTFENGNVDSNIGLLMFLGGAIQPFSVEGDDNPKVMNIIEMQADTEKTISISLDPISGKAGETLPLHIVAIFDAGKTIKTPSISIAFFQALSQAFPAKIQFDEDSTCVIDEEIYNSYFLVEVDKENYSKIDIENSEAESEITLQGFLSGKDQESKYMELEKTYTLELRNTSDEDTKYHIFCFANNEPVLWNDSPYYSTTVSAQNATLLDIEVCKNNEEVDISKDDQLYFIAVPIHDASKQMGTKVLKTKTVNIR